MPSCPVSSALLPGSPRPGLAGVPWAPWPSYDLAFPLAFLLPRPCSPPSRCYSLIPLRGLMHPPTPSLGLATECEAASPCPAAKAPRPHRRRCSRRGRRGWTSAQKPQTRHRTPPSRRALPSTCRRRSTIAKPGRRRCWTTSSPPQLLTTAVEALLRRDLALRPPCLRLSHPRRRSLFAWGPRPVLTLRRRPHVSTRWRSPPRRPKTPWDLVSVTPPGSHRRPDEDPLRAKPTVDAAAGAVMDEEAAAA